MANGEFSKKVVLALSKRAGSHCTICKKITSIPHADPEKFHNLGEAAHIVGQKNGPHLRFDPLFSVSQLSSAKNGIWLCQACHHIIDRDALTYTVEVLRGLKAEHDALILSLHDSGGRLVPALESKELETEGLKMLIRSKELLLGEKEILYNEELNRLKFQLGLLEHERGFLRDQLAKIKSELIDLDNAEIKDALLSGGNVERALELLDEQRLSKGEADLGKARLVKARLLLARGESDLAFENFERALDLWPSYYVADEYIKVLYFKKMDYDSVVRVAMRVLKVETNPRLVIELRGHLAQACLKAGRFQQAYDSLKLALDVSSGLPAEESTLHLVQRARLEKHLGDCCKGLARLPEALSNYQLSLQSYFQATLQGDQYATTQEFAGLATAIGLLYEQNNDEKEGLVHHLRALDVIRDDRDADHARSLILLNIASCYMRRKTYDPVLARDHALAAHRILVKLSKANPILFMEYLIGAKGMLGDIYQVLNPVYCKRFYQQALTLSEGLCKINPVFVWEYSHVQHNYAIYLMMVKGKIDEGLALLDESIALIDGMQEDTLRYKEYMSKALMFKVGFLTSVDDKVAVLKRVIEINRDTDRHDKNFAFKFSAQQLLEQLMNDGL